MKSVARKREASSIEDIGDDEDKANRLETYKISKKKVSRQIKLDHFLQEDNSHEDSVAIKGRLQSKVNFIDKKLRSRDNFPSNEKIKNSKLQLSTKLYEDADEDDEFKQKLRLILDNFSELGIAEGVGSFPSELEVALFRLFLYAVIHCQDKIFTKISTRTFDSEEFYERLKQLMQIRELNTNFESKFIREGEGIKSESINKSGENKTFKKIDIPEVILKRLGIKPSNPNYN